MLDARVLVGLSTWSGISDSLSDCLYYYMQPCRKLFSPKMSYSSTESTSQRHSSYFIWLRFKIGETAYNKSNKIHSRGENDAHQICVTSVPMRINIESSAPCTAGVVSCNSCSPDTSQGQVSLSRRRKWAGTEEDKWCRSSLWGVFVLPSDGVKGRCPTWHTTPAPQSSSSDRLKDASPQIRWVRHAPALATWG